MKKIILSLFFITAIFSQCFAQSEQEKAAAAKQEKTFTSLWEGKVSGLRIILKIYTKEDGSTGGLLDSPDQAAKDLPVASVTLTDDSLKFNAPMLRASFAGKLDKTVMTVTGIFKQMQNEIPLVLKKVDKITEAKRPQTPLKPYPYNSEDITFENNKANITLAGTLTFPKTGNNFRAVVMVTGSGAQDRDESLLNHKPFLVIADYLTRNGYAVLRYDDRGVGKSKGKFATATSADFAGDALAAVEYLKTRKEINQKKIGIMGHSEGGMIAPMCAAQSKDISFIILLAGPGVPGKDIIIRQGELIARAAGEKEEEIAKGVKTNKRLYDIAVNTQDSTLATEKMKTVMEELTASLSTDEKKKANLNMKVQEAAIKQILSPWFRFFLKYDPRQDLVKIKIPVLALNGEKDLQVDPKQNLPEIKKALKKAGNKNFKIVEMPRLNHLFQTIKKGTISEYGEIEETFSPKALNIISEWMNKL